MSVRLSPSVLRGTVICPASKSFAHRALIAAANGKTPCFLRGNFQGDDVESTVSCLRALGARIEKEDGGLRVYPIAKPPLKTDLDVGASGSTLRFMLPLVAAMGTETSFVGTNRLAERPIGGLVDALRDHGVDCTDKLPLSVRGKLRGNEFYIDRPVSSQYVTGLLLCLPLLGGGRVVTTGFTSSKAYVDVTMDVMRAFGATVTEENGAFAVRGEYVSPEEYVVESDWSSASFFLVAGASGDVTVKGLRLGGAQGDARVLDALRLSGARVDAVGDAVRVRKDEKRAFTFSVLTCPDAAPVLSVLAAQCPGKSVLTDTGVLKYKESDRAAEIVKMLGLFGVRATDFGDRIEIDGGTLSGCEYDLPDDHRMAMSAAIAAASATGDVVLRGESCVNKSYPTFFDAYEQTGGKRVSL